MQEDYTCDKCGSGKMRCVGSLSGLVAKHHHQCNNKDCGKYATFDVIYPHIKYVPVEPS
jgi:hypothetical protein